MYLARVWNLVQQTGYYASFELIRCHHTYDLTTAAAVFEFFVGS